MKNFTVHILFLAMLLPLTQCRTLKPNGDLISKTCKQTPNYNLCVKSLRSYPRSWKADVKGLARMMVDTMRNRVTKALLFTKQLIGKRPELEKPLRSCADTYKFLLNIEIPMASKAVEQGNPKFGEQAMNNAAISIDGCERGFKAKSPLFIFNKLLHDTALVASAIIRLLL